MVADAAGQGPDRRSGPPSGRAAARVAALLVLAEGLAVLALTANLAFVSATGGVRETATAWITVALGALAGVGLAVVAWGLLGRRRWARSPALVFQILVVPVGVSHVQSGLPLPGVVLMTAAVVVAMLVVRGGPGGADPGSAASSREGHSSTSSS